MTPPRTKKVVLFSGGRTSGYMLKRLIQKYGLEEFNKQFLVCFANTGKEMPQTLEFVHEVETRWGVKIIWLEYARVPAASIPAGIFPTPRRNLNLAKAAAAGEDAHWFRRTTYELAAGKGEPFDALLGWASVLPNVTGRICSTQLKIRTVMRYLFSLGLTEYEPYIGIRKDEEHRSIQILASIDKFEHPIFPLIEDGVTESEVLGFWKQNDFDLQLQSYQGNCDLCFLKAKWKRVQMARENPGMTDWWAAWEKKKLESGKVGEGAVFRRKEPYTEIQRLADSGEVIARRKTELDIPCSCAERGFDKDAEDVI